MKPQCSIISNESFLNSTIMAGSSANIPHNDSLSALEWRLCFLLLQESVGVIIITHCKRHVLSTSFQCDFHNHNYYSSVVRYLRLSFKCFLNLFLSYCLTKARIWKKVQGEKRDVSIKKLFITKWSFDNTQSQQILHTHTLEKQNKKQKRLLLISSMFCEWRKIKYSRIHDKWLSVRVCCWLQDW